MRDTHTEVSKFNDIFDLESPELLASEPIKVSFFLRWILSLSTKRFLPAAAASYIKALSYSISACFFNLIWATAASSTPASYWQCL